MVRCELLITSMAMVRELTVATAQWDNASGEGSYNTAFLFFYFFTQHVIFAFEG